MEIDQTKIRSGQFITYSNKLWLVLTCNARTSKTVQIRVWCPANNNITDLTFPDPSCIIVVSEPMFTKDFCKGLLDIEKMAPEALSLEKLFDDDAYISKRELTKQYVKLLQYNEALFERLNRFNILFSGSAIKEEQPSKLDAKKAMLEQYVNTMQTARESLPWQTSNMSSFITRGDGTRLVVSSDPSSLATPIPDPE